jgi:hypothetical protein
VAHRVAAADGGLFFIRPSYSKLGSCPTKFAECIACGIPVVTNGGIGDVAEKLAKYRIGPVVFAFADDAYDRAINELETLWHDADVARRCRSAAESDFSLTGAVAEYDGIYKSLESR